MPNGVSVPAQAADRERWTGTIFTFLSTLFYATSNVAMRYLTTQQGVDNDWILFFKESVGFTILLPWLLLRLYQGRFHFTSKRLILNIIIAAVFCQLIGARLHVLGFAVIGLVITVPLIQSSTLLGVAMIGRFALGYPISRMRKIALTVLLVAITMIAVGKELAERQQEGIQQETEKTAVVQQHTAPEVSPGFFLLVAAGTIVAGVAYAIYITILRQSVRRNWNDENSTWQSFRFQHWVGHDHVKQPGVRYYAPFPVTLMMSIVLGTGMIVFGGCLFSKWGAAGFFCGVPDFAWRCILISGIANMVGFFFQIQGLRMTSAVQASLIAVSQIVLLSLIGWLYFAEAVNMLVVFGLVLTISGVLMSAVPEGKH